MKKQFFVFMCMFVLIGSLVGGCSNSTSTISTMAESTTAEETTEKEKDDSYGGNDSAGDTFFEVEEEIPEDVVLPLEEFEMIEKDNNEIESITAEMHFDYPYQPKLYEMTQTAPNNFYSYEEIEGMLDVFTDEYEEYYTEIYSEEDVIPIREEIGEVIRVTPQELVYKSVEVDGYSPTPHTIGIDRFDFKMSILDNGKDGLLQQDYKYFEGKNDWIMGQYKIKYGDVPIPDGDPVNFQYAFEPKLYEEVISSTYADKPEPRRGFNYASLLGVVNDICKRYSVSPADIMSVHMEAPHMKSKNYVYLYVVPRDSKNNEVIQHMYKLYCDTYDIAEVLSISDANDDIAEGD